MSSNKKEKKFFETKEFKATNKIWKQKLKDDGFEDLEDNSENLKQPDTRTIAFENRDKILNFFLRLDHFLTNSKTKISKKHRTVLELYSAGTYIVEIVQKTGFADKTVRNIIKKYKELLK